jgi:acyl carrier protein
LRQHPGVVDCAVVLAKDALAGYAVTTREFKGAAGELRRFLSSKLPDFMVPTTVTVLDALPLTASGKLDRNALPAPDTRVQGRSESVSELQDSLFDIWRKVCGIETSGLDESFFDLGGSSLQLAEVEAELRSRIDATISITDLFAYPTIRSLSRRLENGAGSSTRLEDARERARKQGQAFQNMRSVRQVPAVAAEIPRAETT